MLALARHFLSTCLHSGSFLSSIAGLFTFTGSGSLKLISVIFNLLGIVSGAHIYYLIH